MVSKTHTNSVLLIKNPVNVSSPKQANVKASPLNTLITQIMSATNSASLHPSQRAISPEIAKLLATSEGITTSGDSAFTLMNISCLKYAYLTLKLGLNPTILMKDGHYRVINFSLPSKHKDETLMKVADYWYKHITTTPVEAILEYLKDRRKKKDRKKHKKNKPKKKNSLSKLAVDRIKKS
jgi:hypothetical protein